MLHPLWGGQGKYYWQLRLGGRQGFCGWRMEGAIVGLSGGNYIWARRKTYSHGGIGHRFYLIYVIGNRSHRKGLCRLGCAGVDVWWRARGAGRRVADNLRSSQGMESGRANSTWRRDFGGGCGSGLTACLGSAKSQCLRMAVPCCRRAGGSRELFRVQ